MKKKWREAWNEMLASVISSISVEISSKLKWQKWKPGWKKSADEKQYGGEGVAAKAKIWNSMKTSTEEESNINESEEMKAESYLFAIEEENEIYEISENQSAINMKMKIQWENNEIRRKYENRRRKLIENQKISNVQWKCQAEMKKWSKYRRIMKRIWKL